MDTRPKRSMSYLEWKSFARSRLELEDELSLELDDDSEDGVELKSAAELLNSCRRAKARKASKAEYL